MAMADEISSAGGLQAESPNQYPVKRTMRAAASYNNFAKKIAAENKKITFKFVDGGTVHSIPWSELLDEQEFPFESFDDITEGLKILAPWIDDHSSAIRYAEAIVIPSKANKQYTKKKSPSKSRTKKYTDSKKAQEEALKISSATLLKEFQTDTTEGSTCTDRPATSDDVQNVSPKNLKDSSSTSSSVNAVLDVVHDEEVMDSDNMDIPDLDYSPSYNKLPLSFANQYSTRHTTPTLPTLPPRPFRMYRVSSPDYDGSSSECSSASSYYYQHTEFPELNYVYKNWIQPIKEQLNRLEKRFEQLATPGPVLPQVPLSEFSGVSTRLPPTMANSKTHLEEKADNGYGETSKGPGVYLGYSKSPKFREWISELTTDELRKIEASSKTPEDLSKSLFVFLYGHDLDNRPHEICATANRLDGRELCDPVKLCAIRLHVSRKYPVGRYLEDEETKRWEGILKKLNGHIRYKRSIIKKKQC